MSTAFLWLTKVLLFGISKYPLHIFRSSRPEVFCKTGVLRNFAKFTGKRLWDRCFPVDFANFVRAPFFIEHLRWLFLYFLMINKENKIFSSIYYRTSHPYKIHPHFKMTFFKEERKNDSVYTKKCYFLMIIF